MTNKYKETLVSGSSWIRCTYVSIRNDIGTTPVVLFEEQQAFVVDGNAIITNNLGALEMLYSPTEVIEVTDPNTGELTGETVTQEYVHKLLYSAFIQTAKARDQRNAQEQANA